MPPLSVKKPLPVLYAGRDTFADASPLASGPLPESLPEPLLEELPELPPDEAPEPPLEEPPELLPELLLDPLAEGPPELLPVPSVVASAAVPPSDDSEFELLLDEQATAACSAMSPDRIAGERNMD
jgi:hypothetical protein